MHLMQTSQKVYFLSLLYIKCLPFQVETQRAMESANSEINSYQNVIVMRHGDRLDHIEPLWPSTAKRPWDPPLVQDGLDRAFRTGQRIRSQNDFPIHRVIASPFLRCIQTANEVVAALSAVDFIPNAVSSKDVASIDNTKLKVAIEYGLCEILNTRAIKIEIVPENGKFEFNISDLQAMFPKGTVDVDADMVYKEVPQWDESVEGYKGRYANTLKGLADKYPSENLLIVTHWGGVSNTINSNLKNTTKYIVDYCGSVELRRQILNSDDGFEVVNSHGITFKDNNLPLHPVTNQSTV